jgi:hypothetical protein
MTMRNIRWTSSFMALVAVAFLGCGSSGIGDILGGSSGNDRYDPTVDNVRGTVERVNTRERYIVVDREDDSSNLRNSGDAAEVFVYYDDRTTVEHQGRTYRPDDLEAGDRILADVSESGGRLLAEEIQVLYDVTGGTGQDDDVFGSDRTSELRGTVRYVDTRDRTLEIEPRSSSSFSTGRSDVVVVHYDSSTIVEFEGRRYQPENLERGDEVEVELRDSGGRLLAEEILVVAENQPVGR